MDEGINALVVGTKRFGAHYVRILSQLEPSDNIPKINKIIISRTSLEEALKQAEGFQREIKKEIIGVKIAGLDDLNKVLDEFNPSFTAVVAKDPNIKDNIHPIYVKSAINYGNVLCEKPFANAIGNGESLKHFENLKDSPYKFSLELPFAVVYKEIKNNYSLYRSLGDAENIKFIWYNNKKEGNDAMDNLILHPWSFIAEEFEIKKIEVKDEGNKADVSLTCGYEKKIEINLSYGKNFNLYIIELDNQPLLIKVEKSTNKIINPHLNLETLLKCTQDQIENLDGELLLSIENPLKENIISTLCGDPIVGINKAYASQLFLERIHDYTK